MTTTRVAARCPAVVDIPLTAPSLPLAAGTVDDRFQGGDVPGRTVGRTWRTTTTAVCTLLEPYIALWTLAALVDVVSTGLRTAGDAGPTPGAVEALQGRLARPCPGMVC